MNVTVYYGAFMPENLKRCKMEVEVNLFVKPKGVFPMNDQKLRELLEQVHSELEHTETVDEKGREILRDLDADIRKLLERSDAHADESMLKRIQDTIDQLEIQHPKLTMALSEMMTILSNAGI
jgi:arginyl-tRNA synthetase